MRVPARSPAADAHLVGQRHRNRGELWESLGSRSSWQSSWRSGTCRATRGLGRIKPSPRVSFRCIRTGLAATHLPLTESPCTARKVTGYHLRTDGIATLYSRTLPHAIRASRGCGHSAVQRIPPARAAEAPAKSGCQRASSGECSYASAAGLAGFQLDRNSVRPDPPRRCLTRRCSRQTRAARCSAGGRRSQLQQWTKGFHRSFAAD